MIVGVVVGAGIYIMIGPLAAYTGSALILCYLVALIIAVTSSLCYAQMGSIYPVTAATYRYTQMFYPNKISFIYGWLRWVKGFYMMALMATGFANYFDLNGIMQKKIIALGVLTVFYIINIFGIKTTQNVQTFLVIPIVAGLLIFSIPGLAKVNMANLFPIAGTGVGSLIKGSLSAYFAYTGMYFIAEIGEEIEEPEKNIPRSIIIASIIIGLLYIITAIVYTGGLDKQIIKEYEPNLAQASRLLFNGTIENIIKFCATVAIIAQVNVLFVGTSRYTHCLAKDNILPKALTKKNIYNVPFVALNLTYILSAAIIFFDPPILFLSNTNSAVNLIGVALVAGACLKVKTLHPENIAKAPFSLSEKAITFCATISIVAAATLLLTVLLQDLALTYDIVGWILLGYIYYYARKRLPGFSSFK
jgi:APA family basic amino acid/polyamine antiporter